MVWELETGFFDEIRFIFFTGVPKRAVYQYSPEVAGKK